MTFVSTRDDVKNILLVRGTDESYKAPEKFDKAKKIHI